MDAADLNREIEIEEDAADAEAAVAARREMAQAGERPVPWDELKVELGLT